MSVSRRKGSLTPVYNSKSIPFDIKRVYYLYDIPSLSERGGHAHKNLQQLIIAVAGSFDVIINDSKEKKIIRLNRPDVGLYLPPMIWRELKNFSGGSICLVLASDPYDENDYINIDDVVDFIKLILKSFQNIQVLYLDDIIKSSRSIEIIKYFYYDKLVCAVYDNILHNLCDSVLFTVTICMDYHQNTLMIYLVLATSFSVLKKSSNPLYNSAFRK